MRRFIELEVPDASQSDTCNTMHNTITGSFRDYRFRNCVTQQLGIGHDSSAAKCMQARLHTLPAGVGGLANGFILGKAELVRSRQGQRLRAERDVASCG